MAIPFEERTVPLYRLTKRLAAFILFPFFKVQVNGQSNIPQTGPCLVLPKHQRWEDIPLISYAIARPLYYVAKYELFLNPLSGWLLSSLGGLPLNRSKPSESIQSVKRLFHLLKKGEGIVIFPEGTYYKGKIGNMHKGLIRLILERHMVPLIPVGFKYSGGGKRTQVNIEIGRPVRLEPSDNIDNYIDLAIGEIAELSGLQRNYIGENTDVGT
jgi:1-acyl-sn-glycerol-3-phosphate acyltransferase